jgi:hypothetical protein
MHLYGHSLIFIIKYYHLQSNLYSTEGRCGHDRMIIGFTTTYAISAYHR